MRKTISKNNSDRITRSLSFPYTSVSTDNGSAGMAGNVFRGLVGTAVDAGSGAMYDLKPNPVSVKLESMSEPMPQTANPSPADAPPPEIQTSPPPSEIKEKSTVDRSDELNSLKVKGFLSEEE